MAASWSSDGSIGSCVEGITFQWVNPLTSNLSSSVSATKDTLSSSMEPVPLGILGAGRSLDEIAGTSNNCRDLDLSSEESDPAEELMEPPMSVSVPYQ